MHEDGRVRGGKEGRLNEGYVGIRKRLMRGIQR